MRERTETYLRIGDLSECVCSYTNIRGLYIYAKLTGVFHVFPKIPYCQYNQSGPREVQYKKYVLLLLRSMHVRMLVFYAVSFKKIVCKGLMNVKPHCKIFNLTTQLLYIVKTYIGQACDTSNFVQVFTRSGCSYVEKFNTVLTLVQNLKSGTYNI